MVAVTSPGVTSCDYPLRSVYSLLLWVNCWEGRYWQKKFFAYPGLGQATIDAGLRGDVPLLMGDRFI